MHVVLSLSPGGTERLVIELCRQLRNRVDSVVCCLDEKGDWAAELESTGVPVVALHRRPGFRPSLARAIGRLAADHAIDVLHCHHYTPYVYGALSALLRPVKVVFTEHGRLSGTTSSPKRRLVNPLLSMLPADICAVSVDLQRHMVAEGFPDGRIRVVYNGIDPKDRPTLQQVQQARSALGIAGDRFVVGTVGRLDPVKNLQALLQSVPLLRAQVPNALVVIVGDGPQRATLEAAVRDLAISPSVLFAGYRADVRALLPAFDVFVNCSSYEGVSLTILEAMAAAIPVVAAPVGGNPEVVVDQQTGVLVSSDPAAMAAAVGGLAHDARRRSVLGEAARWRVIRHFSLRRMVDEYGSLYLADRSHATPEAPTVDPTPADSMSGSDATRSAV